MNLNIILTETWETFFKPLQMAANNKRVMMTTMMTAWQNMNWINMMRRIQVEINSTFVVLDFSSPLQSLFKIATL